MAAAAPGTATPVYLLSMRLRRREAETIFRLGREGSGELGETILQGALARAE